MIHKQTSLAHRLTISLSTFSASATSDIIAYPNPCYIKKDGVVKISNIPLTEPDVKVFIYNMAGELVKTLKEPGDVTTESGMKVGRWDGKNESGEMVASGVYIYMIKGETGKKTEKIAVFW